MKYLALILTGVPAITLADTINNQNNDFNHFQQQIRQQSEQVQQAQQQRWLAQHQYSSETEQTADNQLSTVCLPYDSIQYRGFHLVDLPPYDLKANGCISESSLNKLVRDITAEYLAKGYIQLSFRIEAENNQLNLYGKEGKIHKISTEGKKLNTAMLLPQMRGKVLNVKDLDQALDQANKMPNSKVTVDVIPNSEGDVELIFVNELQSRFGGFVGIDNSASKRTGRWQMKAGVNIDSPLGLSDTLYLNTAHTLKSPSNNFSRSISLFHSIPYGYWSFSTFVAFSQFKTSIPLQYSTAQQKGHTWQGSFRADYTFHRGSNHISSVYGQLERIESKSYFQESLISLQSPTLTTVQAGINHLQLIPNGSLVADFNYERGLKWWNATPNQGNDQPEGQYNRWQASLNFDYYYQMKSHLLHQSSRLIGQYSRNYLPAIKQADLLGQYAVRGFRDLSLSAEKSLVLQNSLGKIFQHHQWQIEPYLLFDVGIQKTTSVNSKTEKALSYGVGIKASRPNWLGKLELATGRAFQEQGLKQERSIHLNIHYLF